MQNADSHCDISETALWISGMNRSEIAFAEMDFLDNIDKIGIPSRTRTCDLLLRRQLLLSKAELSGLVEMKMVGGQGVETCSVVYETTAFKPIDEPPVEMAAGVGFAPTVAHRHKAFEVPRIRLLIPL